MHRYLASFAAAALLFAGSVNAQQTSLRPQVKPSQFVQKSHTKAQRTESFEQWLAGFRADARRKGIPAAVLRRAFSGVRFDAQIIRNDRNQAEFTKTIWDYLDTAVSSARVANGKKARASQSALLRRIEAKYQVDSDVVVAIWGLESAFGTFKGSQNTIAALATLAYDSRRAEFFEEELMAALQILASGDVTAGNMKGSWAGAMGHTQFMPTSYLEHAVDITGDGKRDIWGQDPADALASTAAYLKNHGWTKGQPWGVEVRLPDGFDYRLADREVTKSPREWARFGIRRIDGQTVGNFGPASILLPGGAKGPAFMIFENFAVLERYNTADAYVIGVGHLADRIKGGAAFQAGWPRADRALTFDERIELQKRLTNAGFDTVKIDGKIGPLTIAAVRNWQASIGLVPDGYAPPGMLQRLRQSN